MLTLKTLGPGDTGRYYTQSLPDGPAGYYLRGEPGSRWLGDGAARLGLDGPVDGDDLRRVLAGRHPGDGSPLVAGRGALATRTPGYDLTFSPPKSVTLLAVLSDPEVDITVRAAHRHAVDDTVRLVEQEVARVRRGHDGVRQLPAQVVAAAFEHNTSRAIDPQLHTHLVVANLGWGSDGRWSALHSQRLYGWAKTAGTLYQAALRARLTAELGVTWTPVHHGVAEVAGFTRPQLEAFSTRRHQIVAELERLGYHSARAAQLVSWDTRPAKTDVADDVLLARWAHRAAEIGITPDLVDGLTHCGRDPIALPTGELLDDILGPAGLTTNASAFDRRRVLEAVAAAHPDGLTVTAAAQLADRTIADARTIALPAPTRLGDDRYSTAEMLTVEAELIGRAMRRRDTGLAVAPAEQIAAALAARPSLGAEQQRMVTQLLASGSGVEVVVGRAGAGKTYALDAARAAWDASGHRVVGAALAARAAAELQAGAGIASTTVDRLLLDADQAGPTGVLPYDGVLVVDEAGMLGTRKLDRLLRIAERSGTKVVLVGDPRQLPEIEAGGAFAALTRAVHTVELVDNRRQIEPWERHALAELRAGDVARAVTAYDERGRLVLAPDAEAARQQLVDDWWQARSGGEDAAMYALRRADVRDLNARARLHLADAGALRGEPIIVAAQEFAVGDDILALRNDRRLGIRNGTRAHIDAVDHRARTLAVTTTTGAELTIPADYLDAGHLTHAYATTVHKAQGATVDRAFLLGSDALYREAGYVALSRARVRSDLYLVAPSGRELDRLDLDPVARLATQLRRSRAQQLATPPDVLAAITDTDGHLAQLEQRIDELRHRLGPPPRQPTDDPGPELADAVAFAHRAEQRLAATDHLPRRHRHAARTLAEHELQAAQLRQQRAQHAALTHHHATDAYARWIGTNAEHLTRYQQLTGELADRQRVIRAAALADPGAHLIDALGPPPLSGMARERWADTAAAIDTYRQRWDITDTRTLLGPDVGPPEQLAQRRRLEAHVLRHQHALERTLDHGMEL